MLERLNQVIGAFEKDVNLYELYQLSPKTFSENMRETRSKGPAACRVGLVAQKVFEDEGKFLRAIKIGLSMFSNIKSVNKSKIFTNITG